MELVEFAGWSLEQFQIAAEKANERGDALRAMDLADEGCRKWGDNDKLRQVRALALARQGSHQAALDILDKLSADRVADAETLGIRARVYKNWWQRTGSPELLDRAYEAYAAAFQNDPVDNWAGINAATLLVARGETERAYDVARAVLRICDNGSSKSKEPYWIAATRGEALLVLGQISRAEEAYRLAAETGSEDIGNLVSTWQNARIVLGTLPNDVSPRIEEALRIPSVVVFAGHRIDEPGVAKERFPEGRTAAVRQRIREYLQSRRARIGFSSAASGADILFLEAMQALGGQTHIILPCNEETFVRESVATSGGDWVERFHKVRERATKVILASHQRLQVGSVAYDFANELIHGLACLQARQSHLNLVHLAVWDGQNSRRRGGTADIVQRWQQRTPDITVIAPMESGNPGLEDGESAAEAAGNKEDAPAISGIRSEIRALLFADAFHFSQLDEKQLPVFVRHFMGSIAMLLAQTWPRPLFQNTWGDGLFVVFRSAGHAARFAIRLKKRIAEIDRQRLGLPEGLTLRISLHAGPVYVYNDQILNRESYIGSHVNRAARIEPVTLPGHVYATDAFAALCELEAAGQFRFDYVGKISLPKSYGEFPVYDLQAGD